MKKYWISKELVDSTGKRLWHVWKNGVTHSECVAAFESKGAAIKYCDYLNSQDRK